MASTQHTDFQNYTCIKNKTAFLEGYFFGSLSFSLYLVFCHTELEAAYVGLRSKSDTSITICGSRPTGFGSRLNCDRTCPCDRGFTMKQHPFGGIQLVDPTITICRSEVNYAKLLRARRTGEFCRDQCTSIEANAYLNVCGKLKYQRARCQHTSGHGFFTRRSSIHIRGRQAKRERLGNHFKQLRS